MKVESYYMTSEAMHVLFTLMEQEVHRTGIMTSYIDNYMAS
jgi:hypothetical protein